MLDDLSERIFTLMQRSFESTGILLPEQIPNYLHLLDEAIQLVRNATSKALDASEQSTVSSSLVNVLPLRGTSQFALQSRLLDRRKPFLH